MELSKQGVLPGEIQKLEAKLSALRDIRKEAGSLEEVAGLNKAIGETTDRIKALMGAKNK